MKDHRHIIRLRLTKNIGWQILELYKCEKILRYTNEIKRSDKRKQELIKHVLTWLSAGTLSVMLVHVQR